MYIYVSVSEEVYKFAGIKFHIFSFVVNLNQKVPSKEIVESGYHHYGNLKSLYLFNKNFFIIIL